jgi:hypothetical protein
MRAYVRHPGGACRCIGYGFAILGHELASEPRRGRHGYLLPENRADSQFETVPGTWKAQTGPHDNETRQRRVLGYMRGDRLRIGGHAWLSASSKASIHRQAI